MRHTSRHYYLAARKTRSTEFEEPEDFRGTIETLVNSEKLLVPRIPHKPNDIFEVPRIPHKPNF